MYSPVLFCILISAFVTDLVQGYQLRYDSVHGYQVMNDLVKEYQNPVIGSDYSAPTVLRASDGNLYVYGSQSNGVHIQVSQSEDGSNWKFLGDALPTKPSWSDGLSFWAPDVHEHYGAFYLYFTASMQGAGNVMCIGVAISNNPAGPFQDKGSPLICERERYAIDPMAFFDPVSGNNYLYFGSNDGPLKVVQLTADRLNITGSTIPVLFAIDRPYEQFLAGPWVHYRNGYYYLMASGVNCCGSNAGSALSVSRSASPTGPFKRMSEAKGATVDTFLISNNIWVAPGHHSIITDDSGQDWVYYHAIPGPVGSASARFLLMDRLDWSSDGWPTVRGEPSGTPSVGPQPIPTVNSRIDPGSFYNVIVNGGRDGCNTYLSTASCDSNLVDMYNEDDGTGRQKWQFTPVPGQINTYNIKIIGGRVGCNDYLSSIICGGSPPNLVDMYSFDDGSGRQQWVLIAVPKEPHRYNIVNVGRGNCFNYLSCASCGSNLVDAYGIDDGSGRQQWLLVKV